MFLNKITTNKPINQNGVRQEAPKFPRFGIKGNLAPLQTDTITFSGKKETKPANIQIDQRADKQVDNENKFLYSRLKPVAKKIVENSEEYYENYRKTLEKIFKDCCKIRGKEAKNQVGTLYTNLKSQDSILVKLVRGNITTPDEAKEKISDIIRARIVLQTGDKKESQVVFQRILNAIKKDELKLLKIKDYVNRNTTGYLSTTYMNKITEETRDKQTNAEVQQKQKSSGYIATHLIFQLKNGHKAELQIMGPNVALAKEVEDVIYKIETSDKVLNPKHKKIEEEYKKLTKKQKETLTKYIEEVYIEQRTKEMSGVIDENMKPLPKSYGLPRFFDFNEMKRHLENK
ncbi:MAG: hypothetical protein E7Z91_03265 [Cyanobacteria bacterium SIG30]|nr:hypothetical protein [Cyanobacteria bacterium SIG30]